MELEPERTEKIWPGGLWDWACFVIFIIMAFKRAWAFSFSA